MSDHDNQDEESKKQSTPKSPEQSTGQKTVQALQEAKRFLGRFIMGKADDPLSYTNGIAEVLAFYSPEIVAYVCSPLFGLPSKQDWLPSIAQLRAACDARAGELARIHHYKNWGKSLPQPEAKEARPTMEDLKAKYGPNWGIRDEPITVKHKAQSMTKEELAEYYKLNPVSAPRVKESTQKEGSDEEEADTNKNEDG